MLDDIVIRRSGHAAGLYVWITVWFDGDVVINPQGECDSHDGVVYTCTKAQFGDPDTPAGTRLRVSAVLVPEEGDLALRSLQSHGYNSATHPVTFIAESPAILVHR